MKLRLFVLLGVMLSVVSCSDSTAVSESAQSASAGVPVMSIHKGQDATTVAHGGEIYRQYCAACHGDQAQGAPGWHRRGADGKFPPPPLDGSGHVWHHPKQALARTIREGTMQRGGGMPAWGGQLSDADIDAVLAWIQSRWPAELYQRWQAMHKAPGGASHHHH